MTIKIVKLKTGEELVADITAGEKNELKLSKPFMLQMADNNRGMGEKQLALFPYAPYTKDHTVHIKYDNVVWLEELPESMIKDYGTALNNLNSLVRDKNDKSITDV